MIGKKKKKIKVKSNASTDVIIYDMDNELYQHYKINKNKMILWYVHY